MNERVYNIILADDDIDDCSFFKEVLEELPITSIFKTVQDGVELMRLLSSNFPNLPDIIFLDLNMPRKNGLECLTEIKKDEKLKHLPVVIFSTSLDIQVMNLLYSNGAHYYIRKPGEFAKLRAVIYEAIIAISQKTSLQPAKEKFILQS